MSSAIPTLTLVICRICGCQVLTRLGEMMPHFAIGRTLCQAMPTDFRRPKQ